MGGNGKPPCATELYLLVTYGSLESTGFPTPPQPDKSGARQLPHTHPDLVVCGAVNFNWHTYVWLWVLRSHRCPIAYERTARARASKTCVRPAQARESAQQLQDNVSVRHRHATRHCCGRLLL